MTSSRLDRLLAFAQQDPPDPFVLYGLAMEYASLGRNDEALAAFQRLLTAAPAYIPGWHQLGRFHEKLGRLPDARDAFTRGIAAAEKAGDAHARDEMAEALAQLPA